MSKPARVQAAILNGNSVALSQMGRAGGRASAKRRKTLSLMSEAQKDRTLEEVQAMIAERNGDPDD